MKMKGIQLKIKGFESGQAPPLGVRRFALVTWLGLLAQVSPCLAASLGSLTWLPRLPHVALTLGSHTWLHRLFPSLVSPEAWPP